MNRTMTRAAAWLFLAVLALVAAPAGAQRYEQGLLWRVEGPGAVASHLFGTIHLDDPRVAELPAPVERALKEARSVTVELSLETANVIALASRMLYTDGRDLASVAGGDLFSRTASITAKLGIPEAAVRLFKPWAAAVMLMMPQQNPENVLDYRLVRMAAAQNKALYELESVEEQVDAFEGMTEQDQVTMLRQAVDEYARMPQTIERMLKAYLARDLAMMWHISRENESGDPGIRRLNEVFAQRVLDVRNARMADRLQARLKEGGAFVAVGALHLYGDRGVPALLERRGWRITRVY